MRPDDLIRINLDILWKTVQEDLPSLISTMEPLIPPEVS
jgi:uncharacterized protein with HEPN domain